MNHYQRSWFELQLRSALTAKHGTAFEALFRDLMKRRHGTDFVTVAPWGSEGDWKCDGYLTSKRQLFQCYGPREMKKAALLTKIRADSDGAFAKWGGHVDEWTLVHNSVEGAPPYVATELLAIARRHAPARATQWGFEELWRLVQELSVEDNEAIFGSVVTDDDFASLEFRDIIPIMACVASYEPPRDTPILSPDPGKIEANQLPSSTVDFIRMGMKRAKFVDECFGKDADPTLGDRAAEAFTQKYRELRALQRPAGEIFDELRSFAGGGGFGRRSTSQDTAVLTVLAYFFERCDIFEPARKHPHPRT